MITANEARKLTGNNDKFSSIEKMIDYLIKESAKKKKNYINVDITEYYSESSDNVTRFGMIENAWPLACKIKKQYRNNGFTVNCTKIKGTDRDYAGLIVGAVIRISW